MLWKPREVFGRGPDLAVRKDPKVHKYVRGIDASAAVGKLSR
jgi:hypothetical protein